MDSVASPDPVLIGRPGDVDMTRPHAGRLGPDPEPIGVRLDALAIPPRPPRRVARAADCPLALAVGRRGQCIEGACIYNGVPGMPKGCAVRHWAPSIASEPALAEWFLALRRDAALAEEPGSPALLPVHRLASPGPGAD
jgi:hypothetical protein